MKTKGLPENETVTKTSPVPSKLAEIAKKKLAIEVTEEQIEEQLNFEIEHPFKSSNSKVNSRLELAIKHKKILSREILDLEARKPTTSKKDP